MINDDTHSGMTFTCMCSQRASGREFMLCAVSKCRYSWQRCPHVIGESKWKCGNLTGVLLIMKVSASFFFLSLFKWGLWKTTLISHVQYLAVSYQHCWHTASLTQSIRLPHYVTPCFVKDILHLSWYQHSKWIFSWLSETMNRQHWGFYLDWPFCFTPQCTIHPTWGLCRAFTQ